ncbi:MAG: hypothetical protein MR503_01735 [Oscillospiraceae bacterium]|nr:hypothetical protein [Oscillospiraceae bacterium]
MTELKENFKKGWLDEDPRLLTAVLLGIGVFIVLNVLLYKSGKRRKQLKQQAIENKTAIEAVLVYRHRKHSGHGTESVTNYYGRYRYTVNGSEKEYSIDTECSLPDRIMLYPKNSSETRFFSDYDRTSNAGVALNALAAIAVCVLTLWITGYIF